MYRFGMMNFFKETGALDTTDRRDLLRAAPFSMRNLTLGYLLALGLIAGLTIGAHLTLDRVLREHESSAAIARISGQQRTLSQRIASLAAQYEMGSPIAKDDLLDAAAQFEAAHHKLLADIQMSAAAGRNPAVFNELYFGGTTPLDGEVAGFAQLARTIATNPPAAKLPDPLLDRLFAQARAPLLDRLERVVQQHQADSEAQLRWLELMQRLTLTVVLLTLVTEALLVFRPMVRRVTQSAWELLHLASIDALTGMLNRQRFVNHAQGTLARIGRRGAPVSLLTIDVDHFKQINDDFGHAGGDAALQALAAILNQAMRPGDVVGRLCGEEFAVLLPGTAEMEAMRIGQTLRAAVEGLRVEHLGQSIGLTVSIGIACAPGGQPADLQALLHDADQSLYRAKAAGRNEVVGPWRGLVAV